MNANTTIIKYFTLIELLIVAAIIAILISLLLPALKTAQAQGKSAGCRNNLKNLGTAGSMYANDYDDYVITHYENYAWEKLVAPYLGYKTYIKPSKNTNTAYVCPENPEGGFYGNYPSYGYHKGFTTLFNGGWSLASCKISQVKFPAYKFFLADSNHEIITSSQFYPSFVDTSGYVCLRHPGKKTNFNFMDGHIDGYGAPPIPTSSNPSEAGKWMKYDASPPDI